MNNERITGLINKSIDRVITEKEKSELENYLKNDSTVKAEYEQLQNSEQILNDLPEYVPSLNIKKNILNSIETTNERNENEVNKKKTPKTFAFLQPKVVIPFAIGVAAVLLFFFLWNPLNETAVENDFLSGYMGKSEPMLRDSRNIYSTNIMDAQTALNVFQNKNTLYITVDKKKRDLMSVGFEYEPKNISFLGVKENIDTSPEIKKYIGKAEVTLTDSSFVYMIFKIINPSSALKIQVRNSRGEIFEHKFTPYSLSN
jgi:hypothetical protein